MTWTKEDILRFWKSHPIASIAVNGEEFPISSVVLTYMNDELEFYFGTGIDSHKAKALLKNEKVSFSNWVKGEAIVQGTATAIAMRERELMEGIVERIVDAMEGMEDFWPPLLNMWKNDYIIFKLTPNFMRVIDLHNPAMKKSEGMITELTF
jgi:general stress protein 26